jgi:hypothetical protein
MAISNQKVPTRETLRPVATIRAVVRVVRVALVPLGPAEDPGQRRIAAPAPAAAIPTNETTANVLAVLALEPACSNAVHEVLLGFAQTRGSLARSFCFAMLFS